MESTWAGSNRYNGQRYSSEYAIAASHAAFIGSIPEYYDRYLGPIFFEEYGRDLARRVSASPGGTVLEIGAGTGIATRHLRSALPPEVRLVVTDLNDPMLAFARRKFNGQVNMEFRVADATRLGFAEGSFDVVACQFSFMFFPDKPAVLQEVARVLNPGGTFVFSLWDSYAHNHLARTIHDTLTNLFPANPPPFFDTPYGYYRIDEAKMLLGEAGFGDIEISVLPRISYCETARHVAMGFISGTPVCLQIAERGQHTVDEVVEMVAGAVNETYGHPPIHAKMQAIVFKAYRGPVF